jgi:hypothetical protein
MQGLLKVQGAYSLRHKKRKGKQAYSNVEATSRKKLVARYPPLLHTTTFLS